MGFFASKVLLTAMEVDLFTVLGAGALTGEEVRTAVGWHPRGVFDLLDALVALDLLAREGEGPEGRYRNTADTGMFLDKNSPIYLGGILEMANDRLYGFWGDLGEAMRTGRPQSEVKTTGVPVFEALSDDPGGLERFMNAMSGLSTLNFRVLSMLFDFSRYQTLCDAGGATGLLSVCVAQAHAHLRCTSLDLPAVLPLAEKNIAAHGLADRVQAVAGDFFAEPLPRADVITMAMVLHDWNLDQKRHLIRAAYDALPDYGAFIVIGGIIDDARRENAMGLMMSLNMLLEFGDGFDYTGRDLEGWCREAGFKRFERLPLQGPASAVVAYKSSD